MGFKETVLMNLDCLFLQNQVVISQNVVILKKLAKVKGEKLQKAIDQLNDSIDKYQTKASELIKAGLIEED